QREGIEPCELDTRDFVEGAPFTPVQHITFNPASRDHITRVLKIAGWVPVEFTPSGAPKVDDEVLEHVKVDGPNAQRCIELIKEYLMIQKRIGQVAEGDNGWLRMVADDGRIHGSVNPNGAVTGRATHSFPNTAQVPGVKKNRDGEILYGREGGYGFECRASWGAHHNQRDGKPDPWIQVGVDASGLELRCLGHFMYRYDEGEYVQTILTGDIHTKNQLAAGLPTRDNAKTFIYGFLYGAGAAKIGQIVNGTADDGKRLIKNFLEQTPAIAALREAIQESLVKDSRWVGGEQKVTWKRRWIRGLDGRKVHVRSPHAALNTLLQSAGALICKLWIIETERLLLEAGLKHGWDGDFAYMAWVHDEIQVAARTPEIAQQVVDLAQQAMRIVGDHFEFRCQLDTEGKTGPNWAVCH
ncbi:MAG: DNA polymerase, partial [Clostridium sp.]|nr:DNA polymerase [Clostridium sp.]